ncbi:hypothetical protein D3C76_800630 [compost metagenome]
MSPQGYLVLALLALSAYLFWLSKEQLQSRKAKQNGVAYGQAVLAAVEKHFVELKDKQVFLVEDKGYGVIDDSKWKDEVEKFITMIVRPSVASRIHSVLDQRVFHDFSVELIHRLLAEDIFPRRFAIDGYVAQSIKPVDVAQKLELPARWIFSIAFAALAVYLAYQKGWIAAVLMLLASAQINPLIHKRAVQKAPWFERYNLGLWAALGIVVLSTFSYFQHVKAVDSERLALAEETQRQVVLKEQRAAEQRRVEADLQRKAAESLASKSFAEKRSEILGQLKVAIQKEQFDDAQEILEKFSSVPDSELQMLKVEFANKKSAFDAKQAEAKAERERQENYAKSIQSYALDKYTSAQYPKLTAKYHSRLTEIEKLRRRAAERVVDSGKCDTVENVQLSDESTLKALKFFIDCGNSSRFYLTESEIKSGAVARTQSEKAWDEGEAIVACKKLIKNEATIPSSVDFHSFTGTRATTAQTTGNVQVLLDFDAKNAFGAEIGYTARCIFQPQKSGSIEIFLRQ